MFKGLFKRLTCTHDYKRTKTIHGDKIIYMGYIRSIWVCCKCEKVIWSKYLDEIK